MIVKYLESNEDNKVIVLNDKDKVLAKQGDELNPIWRFVVGLQNAFRFNNLTDAKDMCSLLFGYEGEYTILEYEIF